jgi:alkanesulfonate monooxygenase SsuD/methylene tetrahydromethanopterin reductase-like flavin-dependent oxidoreductase (luciferase family)
MRFGIFGHVDQGATDLATLYDERLEFVRAAEAAGLYCYHVSEHHGTPLNLSPVPGVYLAAVARATSRIRLGPLVYLLPLISPLRLIEEICMLDALSRGRFDLGVGRGVSPFELNFHNVDPETSRAVFMEALEAVLAGLTRERLTFKGERFSYENVPMVLDPHQKPHPPIWYASSSPDGSAWGGSKGYHYVTLGAMEPAKACIDAYKEAYAKRGSPAVPGDAFPGGTAVGVLRHVVIADDAAAAHRIARPAYDHWYANLTRLERENVAGPRVARSMFADMDQAIAKGSVIVGGVAEVRETLERQIEELGVNYMVLQFFFGTLPLERALHSLNTFAREIMPALSDRHLSQ